MDTPPNKWTADPRTMSREALLGLPVMNSTAGRRPIRRFRDRYGRVWDVINAGSINAIVFVRSDCTEDPV